MRKRLRLEITLPMIAALVASACGPAAAPGAPLPLPPVPLTCRGFGDALLQGVTVAPAKGRVDYLELRQEPWNPYPVGVGAPPPIILGRAGTACARAVNRPVCEAALGRIRSGQGFSSISDGNRMAPRSYVRYIIANSGDSFEVITTEQALRELLAPFDTTNDVELVAGCGHMRKTAAGWDVTKVHVDTGDCWGGTGGWTRSVVSADGVVTVAEDRSVWRQPTCFGGRRPAGLVAKTNGDSRNSLATFLAESAYLEAASVVAFERLADELATLGAPEDLILRARHSADDETRHAHVMNAFVRELGGTPRAVDIGPLESRSLFAMARENAVEGCVRETFGALVAHYQAKRAERADLRAAMQRIADDETLHAALSWDVAAWLEPRLSADERQQVDDARICAFRDLAASLERNPSPELTSGAGLPRAPEAQRLLAYLASALRTA